MTRHSSVLASSLVLIGLGVAFIAFQGSSALGGLYADLGAAELAVSLEAAVSARLRGHGWIVTLTLATLALAIARSALMTRRKRP